MSRSPVGDVLEREREFMRFESLKGYFGVQRGGPSQVTEPRNEKYRPIDALHRDHSLLERTRIHQPLEQPASDRHGRVVNA